MKNSILSLCDLSLIIKKKKKKVNCNMHDKFVDFCLHPYK